LPWGPQYLLPAEKWWPIYWPNQEWQVVPFTGPPDGAVLQWWHLPKDQWPQAPPFEPKILGCWPASKVTVSEDLPPSIWPGGHKTPPFGFIKLLMPGQRGLNKEQQISFMNMKIHMRPHWVSHFNHLKIISRDTPMGQKFYLMDNNWEQHEEYSAKNITAALKRIRQEKFREMLAAEIVRKTQQKPTSDLFK
jgi:hypothetical protein